MNSEGPISARDRAGSFGGVAEDYDRWRLGPSPEAVDWLLPSNARRVVDLGAGTGALSRLLIERVGEIIAVEPDPRMRAILERNVPGATVLEGTGERLPVDDVSVDAVLVSSAWHWMEVEPTVAEAARVLRPQGILGVVWAGPDPTDSWFVGLREFVMQDKLYGGLLATLADQMIADDGRMLKLPAGSLFAPPEHTVITSAASLNAEQLVGMLGTFSSVIVLPDDQRRAILEDARRLFNERGGLTGDATVQLRFRADCWRATRIEG